MKKIAVSLLALCSLLAPAALAAPSAEVSATKSVRIEGFAFKPGTLTVAKGTRVSFRNEDKTAHTATRNGGGFNSGRIGAGKSFAVTFSRTGTFRYHCSIHPSMKGKVVVE